MVDTKVIAVIPARGGSKRIPKKNIIEFQGKHMIGWTIEAAIKSKIFDDIIVSTDDDEIAEVSRSYGADTPFKRITYTDDYAPISKVTVDAVSRMKKCYDYVIQLMPNCPLRTEEHIIEHYNFFFENNFDFQISCFSYNWINPYWAHTTDINHIATPLFKENYIQSRSQDLDKLYCPTGAIWIAKVNKLLESENFYGKNYRFCSIDWKYAIDIDDYEDLEMANILFHNINNID